MFKDFHDCIRGRKLDLLFTQTENSKILQFLQYVFINSLFVSGCYFFFADFGLIHSFIV